MTDQDRIVTRLKRRLEDQQQRIDALARGREEGMATVSDLRAELKLVAAERDRLRRELTELEGMQTETLAFDEASVIGQMGARPAELPSIDELMATFSGHEAAPQASHATLSVDSSAAEGAEEYQEMISPELIVLGSNGARPKVSDARYLVLLGQDRHTQCLLDQDLMTIGRSESADIKVVGDFISRIHARVLRIGMDTVIEDAGSKNGTLVNDERVDRRVLSHGDLVRVGSANLRFVDSTAPTDAE